MGQTASSPELPAAWVEILPTLTREDILREYVSEGMMM
jgi:hypothetical protein